MCIEILHLVSEWGTSRADGSGGVFTQESETWLNFLHQNGISWANWSLCDKNETSAALKPGTPTNRPWTGNDLTPSWKFVFSHFRKSQHIFAKKIKKFQTQAAKAVEKTASADRKPRISRG